MTSSVVAYWLKLGAYLILFGCLTWSGNALYLSYLISKPPSPKGLKGNIQHNNKTTSINYSVVTMKTGGVSRLPERGRQEREKGGM